MTDLKPCPFCGNEGKIVQDSGGGDYAQDFYYPECSECTLEWASSFDTYAEAVEAWNTRADRPAGGVDLDEVQRWEEYDFGMGMSDWGGWVRFSDLQALQPKGVSAWIPVSERLPEVQSPRSTHSGFWVYRPGIHNPSYWETLHPANWSDESLTSGYPITHWLDWTIPAPPETERMGKGAV